MVKVVRSLLFATILMMSAAPAHAFSVIQGTGAVGTQDAVDAFRATVGDPNNGINVGPQPSGRREINWAPSTARRPAPHSPVSRTAASPSPRRDPASSRRRSPRAPEA